MTHDDLTRAVQQHVDDGRLTGAAILVARGDHIWERRIGDAAGDLLFRIASLTKPMTAAITMRMIAVGELELRAPVDRWFPELASRRVLPAVDAPLEAAVPAHRPIVVEDLLSMRMGLGALMISRSTPLSRAMRDRGVQVDIALDVPSREVWLERVADLPLYYEPGTAWMYDTSYVALGALLERASGLDLPALFRKHLFDPLGMNDTGFSVDAAQAHRLPRAYAGAGDERRTVEPAGPQSRFCGEAGFCSAAAGLVSTPRDVYAFFRSMLDAHRDGNGVVSSADARAMTTDHIAPAHQVTSFSPDFWTHFGYGYGVGVIRRPADALPRGFGWDGGYGITAYADPETDTVAILATQRLMDGPSMPEHFRTFWRHVSWT